MPLFTMLHVSGVTRPLCNVTVLQGSNSFQCVTVCWLTAAENSGP